jgi:hypothetical protein
MELPTYKVNVGAMEHPSMGTTVPIVNANMVLVRLNQPHHLVIATMVVVVLHKANGLAFYVICATRLTRNAKVIVNRSFLVPDVSEYVMRILHMTIITVFVIQCVHRVGPVALVMGTELAMMVSVIVTPTGSTKGAKNA